MRRACTLVLLLLAGSAGAQAPSVWRCGNAYSSAPCEGGRAVALVDDQVSAADLARARQTARDERRTADALQRERLQREAMPGARAIGIGPVAKAAPPAKPAVKKKPRKKGKADADPLARDGDFVVRLPKVKAEKAARSTKPAADA